MRRNLAKLVLWLFGWKPQGQRPRPDKFVLIAAPHTSNWDFVFLLAFAACFDLKISWLGKREMFRWPFAGLLARLGGIAVSRAKSGNLVEQLAALFRDVDSLCLVFPAEGTRGYVDYWKSGFYHVACVAEVPIVPSVLDYASHRGGFGPPLLPSGDISRDMDCLREFYAGATGKYPQRTGRIRLKEENELAEASGG